MWFPEYLVDGCQSHDLLIGSVGWAQDLYERELLMSWPVAEIRRQFVGLQRRQQGAEVALFDGPAGSQVPESVVQAVSGYLRHTNCNRGGPFATARESDAVLEEAQQALADFVGSDDPDTIVFGANMTTLTLKVSRTLSQRWQPGDEIIVSRLDHDANVTPWVLAARDRGVTVRHIDLNPSDWTLDLQDFERKLSDRTRLVAVGYASNATGTINPVARIVQTAHQAGALVYVDAVHFAPHGRIAVQQLGCDFLVCSAYKFFGPHAGVLWGRRELLEDYRPDKLRPAPEALPGRWMTGTQNHEGMAGAAAAVNYLASLDEPADDSAGSDRSAKLDRVFGRIRDYEMQLTERLISGLSRLRGVRVYGIVDPVALSNRVPTVSFTLAGYRPRQAAERLAEQGVYAWCGNHYALPFTEAAGLEPDGTIRVGALHYNTLSEVDRLLKSLQQLV